MLYNPTKSSFLNPNIEYLFNNEIIEYDMRDAGFSIIKHYKLLDDDEIKKLSEVNGKARHIAVGNLQKLNKDFSKSLGDKFAEMRRLFVESNKLTDNDIITVKKDAIYTVGVVKRLKFGQVEFIPKNRYSSYIRFTENMNIELFYNSDTIEIKGIGDSGINRHRLYFLDFLNKVVGYFESGNPTVKRFLRSFIDQYKANELDEEYYVEFNNSSRDHNPMYNYQKILVPLTQIALREFD